MYYELHPTFGLADNGNRLSESKRRQRYKNHIQKQAQKQVTLLLDLARAEEKVKTTNEDENS